ncbi:MAG TPA: HlyD family efflux transporter periplasmic adaptor subunit [Terriglobales bacterium]|nr:HlyD family efflux transporter periplasmic adaptor subunit [Terriglobales bacterium]
MSELQTMTLVSALPSETQKKAPAAPRPKWMRWLIWLVVLHVPIAVAGYLVYRFYFAHPATPKVVALSGRIEGDDSAVAPKVTGRILEIRFREGDSVKAGEVVAILDDPQVHAREQQARDQATAAEAQLSSAQQQIAVLNDQLKQTELQTNQATTDAGGRVSQAEAELAHAEAQLAQQEASLKLALFDRDAYTKLAADGAVSERQGKSAQTTAETQQALVAAARREVESAQGSVNVAKANLANPQIRFAQQAQIRKQIAQQQATIASSRADADRARSQLKEAQENIHDLTVVAPFDGTIATRTAEPGEVIQAGTAIVTLIDLTKVYLRGFIPEGEIGRVRVDQRARVFLDSDRNKPLEAVVSRIDPQATFTPENTYFRDDRVKQVVGVKLLLKAGIGYAKPGMPADGAIEVDAR